MSLWQSVWLGVVQGVSEFIPISSSGHLVVMRAVMGVGEIPRLYDVVLHIATLIVVVVFFRARILQMLSSIYRFARRTHGAEDAENLKLTVLVLIATVLTAGIGLTIGRFNLHLYPKLVAVMFLVTAALLISARFTRGSLDYSGIGTRHAVLLGIVQGLAVIPGVSRSGSTIAAALHSGISRQQAGEFSFLISVPAILGALILELRHFGDLGAAVGPVAVVGGFVTALLFGFLALTLLVRLIHGGKLWVFSVYLIPLGVWGLLAL